MDFSSFLSTIADQSIWKKHQKFVIRGQEYPLHFFSMLNATLAKTNPGGRTFKMCRPHQVHSSQHKTYCDVVLSHLNQSFLGSYHTYWLGDLSALSKKERKKLFPFLFNYAGQHHCSWYVSHDIASEYSSDVEYVHLPRVVDAQTLTNINSFFNIVKHPAKLTRAVAIVEADPTFSLDSACALLDYLSLVSAKDMVKFDSVVPSLFQMYLPLSDLSSAFFSRNPQDFFNKWATLEKKYSVMFWVAFWSEQVWRAHNVIHFMQHNNFAQAKRMSFRLPSQFIYSTWQSFTLKELAEAHQFLYTIDYAFKTGSTINSFDVFFSNYFMGTFS